MPAPSLFTKDRRAKILAAIRNGASRDVAARLNGITDRTLYEWIAQGKADLEAGKTTTAKAQFAQEVSRADEELRFRLEAAVIRGGQDRQVGGEWVAGDWRAALAYLKARWPQDYSEHRDLTKLLERRFQLEQRLQEQLAMAGEMMLSVIASRVELPADVRLEAVAAYAHALRALEGDPEPIEVTVRQLTA